MPQALDNASGTACDAAAVQWICDGLIDQKIYRFANKWLARLPQPFTREDEDADYRWQLSVQQVGFSTTMALDRPVTGRISSSSSFATTQTSVGPTRWTSSSAAPAA